MVDFWQVELPSFSFRVTVACVLSLTPCLLLSLCFQPPQRSLETIRKQLESSECSRSEDIRHWGKAQRIVVFSLSGNSVGARTLAYLGTQYFASNLKIEM